MISLGNHPHLSHLVVPIGEQCTWIVEGAFLVSQIPRTLRDAATAFYKSAKLPTHLTGAWRSVLCYVRYL